MHYNFYSSRTIQMQNVNNLVPFSQMPSFYYISNPVQYYTFLPITPTSDTSTPVLETSFNSSSFIFPPQIDQGFYYAADQHSPYTSSSQLPLQTNPIISTATSIQHSEQHEINSCSVSQAGQTLSKVSKSRPYKEEKSKAGGEGSALKQNQKSKIKRIKIEEQQKDKPYHPKQYAKKKFIKKYQSNENRNILPNSINQTLSFLRNPGKSGALVQRMFLKYPPLSPDYSPTRYYQYQDLIKNKLGHYTNERSLRLIDQLYDPKCENWTEEQQCFYNKISRVLIRHFLYEEMIFLVLTSKRMRKDKKRDHLRARRQISADVFSVLKRL